MFKFDYSGSKYYFSYINDNEEIVAACTLGAKFVDVFIENKTMIKIEGIEDKIKLIIDNIKLVFDNFNKSILNVNLDKVFKYNQEEKEKIIKKIDIINFNKELKLNYLEFIYGKKIQSKNVLIKLNKSDIKTDYLLFVNQFLNSFDELIIKDPIYDLISFDSCVSITRKTEKVLLVKILIESEEINYRFSLSDDGYIFEKGTGMYSVSGKAQEITIDEKIPTKDFIEQLLKKEITSRKIKNTIKPIFYHVEKNKNKISEDVGLNEKVVSFYKTNYKPREVELIFKEVTKNKDYYSESQVYNENKVLFCVFGKDIFVYVKKNKNKKLSHFNSDEKEEALNFYKETFLEFLSENKLKLEKIIESKSKKELTLS